METSERQIEAAGAVVQLERDEAIARIHAELSTPGAEDCIDCGQPIPARRRAAMPSAVRCIACQSHHERANS